MMNAPGTGTIVETPTGKYEVFPHNPAPAAPRFAPNFRASSPGKKSSGGSTGAAISDEKYAAYLAGLTPGQKSKLGALASAAVERSGFQGVRAGSDRWETHRRKIAADLVKQEISLDDIELPEKRSKSKWD